MRAYWTLTRRELAAFFLSLTGYVIIAAALFVMALASSSYWSSCRSRRRCHPVTELFYITPFFWLLLLLTTR